MDTIFALATAQGKAGVAVVRISGPAAWDAGLSLCGSLPKSHHGAVRSLHDTDGVLIDQAFVIPFETGRSFTGEAVVELHLHGSIAVVSAVLEYLKKFKGLCLAEPGEFTRRALENGKLDLARVEGLADLIDAETEAQRKQALRVLSGELGDLAAAWRVKLIRAASLLEATIDFADEDVPFDVTPEVDALLSTVEHELHRQISGVRIAERVRTGFEVAIVGAPNVGKSTLLNALAGRDAAITSEFAGTTRDVIEVRMDLAGLPVTLLDTAGLRETVDHVEAIGIERAVQRAENADLIVYLTVDGHVGHDVKLSETDLVVRAKVDQNFADGLAISGLTGAGVDDLVSTISERLTKRSLSAGLATRDRHKDAMELALGAIAGAKALIAQGPDIYDMAAEEMRISIRALESLIGHVDVENLLDEIFSSFCLGK